VNIITATRSKVLLVPNAALRFRPADAARAGQNQGQNSGQNPVQKQGQNQDRPKGDKAAGGNGKDKDKGDFLTGTVYVQEKGSSRLKPIRVVLGITDSRMTEVADGELKEGDEVVVEDRQPPANKAASGPPMRMF